MAEYYVSQTVSGTVLTSGDVMYVSSGGTGESIVVSSGGRIVVSSGGTALDLQWTPCVGTVEALEGAVVTYAAPLSGVWLGSGDIVYSSAAAVVTGEDVKGSMYVYSGGAVDKTTVNGYMYVSSGGTADSTTVNWGGNLYVSSGGTANGTTVNSRGYLTVSSGGTANSTTVSGGNLTVSSGGTANSTTVNDFGYMYVSLGGTANSTVNDGDMYVFLGGTANSTVNDGDMYVFLGGTANSTTVNSAGSMMVSSGGTANSTTVNSGGRMYVYGGTANSTTVNYGGRIVVSSGGTANSTTVSGVMTVSSGGTANSITVSGGYMYISSGGTALDIVWTPCVGYVWADGGATVTYVSSYSGVYFGPGETLLSSAMTMAGKTVTGFMYVMTSGTANSTTVNLNGNLYVWSGGTANSTTVNWAGRMYVSSGGTANSTTVNSSGYLYVSSGGTADSTTVNSGGRMYVSSGGTADSTTVSGGYMYVENSGTANSITVNGYYGSRSSDGGYLYVSSGGTVIGAAVTSGGSLHVFSGGTALNVAWTPFVGVMEAENGAIVTYVSSYSGVYFGSGESQFSSAMTMAGKTVTGSMYVMTSGAVTYTTVDNGGSMVVANATADSTTVNYGGYLYISNGGTANSTTVNGASHTSHGEIVGALYVSSGGTANSTTVNRFGRMFVSSGGTADSTTVNDGGNLYVSSGGTADSTTVNSGGDMTVYDGGTANSTTVNSSSYMYVSSGGTATAIMENGGYVAVAEGANVTFASNTFSGLMLSKAATLHSGTTAVSTTVKGYGYLYVSSGGTANSTVNNGYMYVSLGGTANSTTVNTLGHLYVSSGGTANSTTVNGSGDMTVYDGGTANSTTVIWSGYLTVSSGGTANSTTVNSWGYLTVCSGGTANSTTVNYGGCMFVSSGGTASIVFDPWRGQVVSSEGADVTYLEHDANIYYGGKGGLISKYDSTTGLAITSGNSTIIFSGGTANSTTVNSSGYLYVSSGGTADSTTVNDGGNLYVSSGGTANSTTVNSWGYLTVCSGGTANNTTVNQSGYLMVSGGGTATNIVAVSGANLVFGIASDTLIQGTIDGSAFELRDTVSGGIIDRSYDLHVSSGGTANFTTVNRYGSMFVSSGGTANSTTVNGSGYLTVSSGGTANSTTVNPDGKMTVYDGGTATSTTVNYYGYLTVSSGGTANGTTVNSGGRLYVGSSGTATSTTVNYYGSMFVFSGGTADSTTVNSGGRMFVSRGGKVTGPLTIESGGGVTVSSGGIIDFDISALASQNTALVNDLSLIKGTPTYTITVSGGQATGTYTLAEGAADFSAAISVRTSTENLGTVVVNGAPLSHNDCTYTLVRTDSTLTLRVAGDEIPPDAPRASADITAPTGKNVTVTAVFSEDSAQRQYSLDNSDWLAYTAPVVMTENGSVYFRGIDAAGNISKVTEYVVSNIDKTVPEITVTADVTSPTRGNVTVTALFSDDAVEKLYGFDNETWTAYTSPVVMTENGIVYFKGVNAIEGAAVTSYTVSNIYKTAPVLTVTGNPESWTNRDVTLTAASGEEAEIEYSFDNAAWTAGSEVTVTENGTVYFRATDPAGNVTAETVVVDKIDKIPPETPAASADSVLPTNKDVTVTAEFGGDAAQREYSLDGNNWSAYTSGVVMTENGTVYFRGIDAAGNVSQVTEYVVSNIDKTLPDAPEVSADFTSPTRGNVTVTAVFGGDVAEKLYGFDGETWLAYTSPVVVTENGTVYFKSVGPTGKSAVTPYQVANIDRTAPTLTVTGNPADWTNKDVTLTAACDENAEIEYSFDNETWTAGSEVTVGENATVYFRATDAAGNVSAETVVVDKIDKIPPEAPETSVDVTTPTSGTVTVRAAFGADAARKEYSPDGTTWLDYAGGVTLSSNGTVYFRAVDAAGNISDLSSRTVTNIIKGAVVFYSSGIGSTTVVSAADVMSGKAVDSAVNLMRVNSGGLAAAVSVNSGGKLYVMEGGSASAAAVNSGGRLYVSSGGIALETAVSSGGKVYVCSGGTAEDLSVAPRGSVFISSGASVVDASVGSGGKMYVSGGGKVTGRLDLVSGAVVSAYSGGIIDFDLSTLAPGNAALVTDLARLRGTPDFTVTVSPTQTEGLYGLADGAADFGQIVIIVRTDAGRSLGTVSVGNTVTLAGRDYTLGLASDALTLTVAGDPVISGLPGDLNGDGRADIIMTVTEPGHGAEGATGAWLIQSDQTAVWGDLSQRNAGWEIFGTGVTAAGKTANDVYVKSTGNVIGAWVTDDTGHVTGWETVGQFDEATQILGLGDFNADGQTDLLLRNDNGAVGCYFTGGEKTGWNYFQSLGDEWRLAAVGDFNADGRADAVLVHDAGFAGTWLTQADGTVAWADLDTLGEGFSIAGCGDFDGDGTDDVLLQKGSYYGAWLVEAGSAKSWFGLGDLGDVTVEQIADFDGDGKDDLRIRTSAGDLGTQLVRGADTLEWRYYGSVGEEWSTRLAAI